VNNHQQLRIGVTIHYRDDYQSVWENGIFQNCFFLVKLFEKLPNVEFACLLVDRDTSISLPKTLLMDNENINILGLDDGMEVLNIVIEMSALLPDEWAHLFREKGGRYYWMRVGNDYFLDVERTVYNKPHAALIGNKKYDAIWTLPEYENSCKEYFELSVRAPVFIAPHIWTPYFLEHGISSLPYGLKYGYQSGRPRWRVSVLEPNVSLVKTYLIPILAIENAYRKTPKMFDSVRVCNTLKMKEHKDFVSFCSALDIVKHGVATFEGRFPTPLFMATESDVVVSHHWENGQNYLYYELLYGGYPLVHNSSFIKDNGYYYDGFDVMNASKRLIEAYLVHDERINDERDSWFKLEKKLDIENADNMREYMSLLSFHA